jgi:MFS family permease
MALISEIVSPSQLGVAYGVSETTSSVAIIIAPLLAGLFYVKNPGYIFQLSILLIVTSILLSFAFIKRNSN